MIQFSNGHKWLIGYNIDIIYNDYTDCTAHMVLEHYDNEQYKRTLFVINDINMHRHGEYIPSQTYNLLGGDVNIIDINKLHDNYDKIILYHLEHIGCGNFNIINYKPILDMFDEIWYPWLESYAYLNDITSKPLKFMPMRYTTYLKPSKVQYEIDLGFIGAVYDHREEILGNLLYKNPGLISFLLINYSSIYNCIDIVNRVKYLLDLPTISDYSVSSQNVVRCMEGICAGKQLVSLPVTYNYFGDNVIVFDDTDQIIDYVMNNEPTHNDDFKLMTYNDKDYNIYINDIKTEFLKKYGINFRYGK